MKFWTRLILLTLIDFIIIWLWVRQQDPDPSISIGVLILVPFVIAVNLIIAGILFATNRRSARLFVINSFISAVLVYVLFGQGISRHQRQRYESWIFQLQDTIYRIDYYKPDTTFSISYSTNPSSSSSYVYGHVFVADKHYVLANDTLKLVIKNNHLFGFRRNNDSIKLNQISLWCKARTYNRGANIPADEQLLNKLFLLNFNTKFKLMEC